MFRMRRGAIVGVAMLAIAVPVWGQASVTQPPVAESAEIYRALFQAAIEKTGVDRGAMGITYMAYGPHPPGAPAELSEAVRQRLSDRGIEFVRFDEVRLCPSGNPSPRCSLPSDLPLVVLVGLIRDAEGGGLRQLHVNLLTHGFARQPIHWETWEVTLAQREGVWAVVEWTLLAIT